MNSLSKCFEQIIKKRVLFHCKRNNILPLEQFGFRPGHSAVHQVHRISNHIKTNFRAGKSTGMVLLDVEKAFDTVWHNAILHKLLRLNFPIYLIKIIQSFLLERKFKVSINNWFSDTYIVLAGVPQGSVLGPILYTIFTYDFPCLTNCEKAIFADDTCIYSSDSIGFNIETNLQSALYIIQDYFFDWNIKMNASKTQTIFFTRKRKACFLPSNNLVVNGIRTEWRSRAKYLGVYLDKTLTFGFHVQEIIKKVRICVSILYTFINRKSKLSNENKLLIFKVIFQAIMFYGSPVWGKCASSHVRKLQIAQNKVLKMILNLPWSLSTSELHKISNIELVSTRLTNIFERYAISCELSENRLISNLAL